MNKGKQVSQVDLRSIRTWQEQEDARGVASNPTHSLRTGFALGAGVGGGREGRVAVFADVKRRAALATGCLLVAEGRLAFGAVGHGEWLPLD